MSDVSIPMIFDDCFSKHCAVAWRVEPGKLDPHNPLMTGQHPWDGAHPFYLGTVLKDPIDGQWKSWGIAAPIEEPHEQWSFRCAYATSADGVHWERPRLAGFPCLGQERTNVLMDFPDGGSCYQMSVLVDPAACPERRYEMFILRQPAFKNPTKRIKDLPLLPHHKNYWGEPAHPFGVYRYFSPDGIHWKISEGPLLIQSNDSLYVYKDLGAPYVAYHKLEVPTPPGSAYVPHDYAKGGIRRLVRRESQDGTHWSDPPLPVMVPDWRDAHDTQFMDIGPIREGSGFVATVAVFHGLNQMMDIQFTGSRDGKTWFRPIPRVPCVPNGALGEYGGGHIFQSRAFVPEGDKLHLYYAGDTGLHTDIYSEDPRRGPGPSLYGGLCRATWERGRLWALAPAFGGPREGHATARPIPGCTGKSLFINALTLDDGEVSAELCTGNEWDVGAPFEGYSRADCVPFRGDSKCTKLVWKTSDRCPREGLLLRFHLRRARLYGFEWR
ncbi:MAG: hypothetical protein V2A58_01575 [Planctomycetota bacterium]